MESALSGNGLCSVIMPVHNSAAYVASSIESVLQQTYRNLELVIINDASTDDSLKHIKESTNHCGIRVKVISFPENRGVAAARNKGLEQAAGEYIAFLDSDDLWHPEKIRLQTETLRKTGRDLCFVAYDMIDEAGRVIKHRPVKPDTGYTDLLKENNIIFSGVLGRAECIKEQRFDPRCFHEDYLFLLELLQKGKRVRGLDRTLLQYRVHGSGKSFDKKNAAWQRWKIYRDYLHMSMIKSIYYFVIYAFNGVLKYI